MQKLFLTIVVCLFFSLGVTCAEEDFTNNFSIDNLDLARPINTGIEFKSKELFGTDDLLKEDGAPKDKSDVVACGGAHPNIGIESASSFANFGQNIGSLNSCNKVKSDIEELYSEQNCKLIEDCQQSLLSKDDLEKLNVWLFPKYLAEDYVKIKLDDKIYQMEKVEAVRKFSDRLYGSKFVSNCQEIFDYSSASALIDNCDISTVDNSFNQMQQSCGVISRSCYNPGINPKKEYNAFLNGFNAEINTHDQKNESVVQSFFKSRIDATVSEASSGDDAILGTISAIASSHDTKDNKIHNIFGKLSEYKNQGKLDPIFAFDTNEIDSRPSVYKKSMHYEFFKKLLSKGLNFKQVKSEIEKHRMLTAKNILAKTCSSTPRLKGICSEATSIMKHQAIPFYSRRQAADKLADSDEQRYDSLSSSYPEIKDKETFKLLMDAQRCKAFNFDGAIIKIIAPDASSIVNREFSSSSHMDFIYNKEWEKNKMTIADSKARHADLLKRWNEATGGAPAPSTAGLVPAENKSTESANSKVAPVVGSSEKVETNSANQGSSSNFSESAKSSSAGTGSGANITANFPSGSVFNNFNHSYINANNESETANKGVSSDPAKSGSSSANILNDKISELTKRLATSEENLERIKVEKEAAETQKARQLKIDEENQTISNLKAQIENFKSEAIKDAATKNNLAAEEKSSAWSNEKNSAQIITDNRQSEPVEAQNITHPQSGARNNESTASASVGSEVQHSASRPTGTSTDNSNGVAQDLKSNLVLTKIDGLSSEKASETIYEKIAQLKGVPFLIEEGGVVKKIIPKMINDQVVTDQFGKPVFETVVIGKSSKENVKKRLPANITSKADLMHEQEDQLSRERAEYLKLKKITNDLMNKK